MPPSRCRVGRRRSPGAAPDRAPAWNPVRFSARHPSHLYSARRASHRPAPGEPPVDSPARTSGLHSARPAAGTPAGNAPRAAAADPASDTHSIAAEREAPRTPPLVWLDTDIALGCPRGDVDDGFALAALLAGARAGLARLAGVSSVGGNAVAAVAERCARALCERDGWGGPVVRGADPGSARDGPGRAAAEALARLPDGAEIVALGPLTNVDRALAIDPTLPRRARLRVVGGNLSSRGFLPPLWPYEFNFARDRGGAGRALSAPWRQLVLFPLDVVSGLRADRRLLDQIGAASPVGTAIAAGSRRWLSRAGRVFLSRSFPVWDLPAALHALGLPVGEVSRRPAPASLQRLLGGVSGRPLWLSSLDSGAAWEAFRRLLSGGSMPE